MTESKAFLRDRSSELISLPVLRAFFLQALALILIYLLLHAAWRLTGLQLTLPIAALLQGSVAAALSWRRLPSWWLPIQFVLPAALIGAGQLELPSWIFLLAFLFLLALYWTTFRTRVPYYPSGPAAWSKVTQLLPPRPVRVIDIGSGFGGAAFFLARQRSDIQVTGIEIAPLPWAVSAMRVIGHRLRGEAAPRFVWGSYERLDFAEYDVIFAYLSPAAMPALWEQACAQMRPGSLLLSYEFEIPGHAPHFTAIADRGRCLHGWRI